MFKFKLQSVLALKEQLEEAKKRELGVLNSEKQILEEGKKNLCGKERQVIDELVNVQQEHINIQTIKQSHNYLTIIKHRKKELQEQINETEKVIQIKREELIEAMAERKILDNLKQIKKEEFIAEIRKEEEKLVDEIVSYKYTKNEGG